MEKSRSNIAPIIPESVPLSQINVWIHSNCQYVIWLPLFCILLHELAEPSVTEQGLKENVNFGVLTGCILHLGCVQGFLGGCERIQGFFLSSHCNSWVQLKQESQIIVCKGHCSNAAEEHDLNLIIKLPQQEAARDGVDGPSAKSVLLLYKEEGRRGRKSSCLAVLREGETDCWHHL